MRDPKFFFQIESGRSVLYSYMCSSLIGSEVQALVVERRIRDKIKQLQIQRRNGITTFEDAEEFERFQV